MPEESKGKRFPDLPKRLGCCILSMKERLKTRRYIESKQASTHSLICLASAEISHIFKDEPGHSRVARRHSTSFAYWVIKRECFFFHGTLVSMTFSCNRECRLQCFVKSLYTAFVEHKFCLKYDTSAQLKPSSRSWFDFALVVVWPEPWLANSRL